MNNGRAIYRLLRVYFVRIINCIQSTRSGSLPPPHHQFWHQNNESGLETCSDLFPTSEFRHQKSKIANSCVCVCVSACLDRTERLEQSVSGYTVSKSETRSRRCLVIRNPGRTCQNHNFSQKKKIEDKWYFQNFVYDFRYTSSPSNGPTFGRILILTLGTISKNKRCDEIKKSLIFLQKNLSDMLLNYTKNCLRFA